MNKGLAEVQTWGISTPFLWNVREVHRDVSDNCYGVKEYLGFYFLSCGSHKSVLIERGFDFYVFRSSVK